MLAVVSVLSTSLVAVPALRRVDPATTSGPGSSATVIVPRGTPSRAARGLHATSTVAAPARRAAASAPRTNGVTALAETPTTASPSRTRARTARAARHDRLDQSRRSAEGRRALCSLEHAEPSARAGADEKEAAAMRQRFDD